MNRLPPLGGLNMRMGVWFDFGRIINPEQPEPSSVFFEPSRFRVRNGSDSPNIKADVPPEEPLGPPFQ